MTDQERPAAWSGYPKRIERERAAQDAAQCPTIIIRADQDGNVWTDSPRERCLFLAGHAGVHDVEWQPQPQPCDVCRLWGARHPAGCQRTRPVWLDRDNSYVRGR